MPGSDQSLLTEPEPRAGSEGQCEVTISRHQGGRLVNVRDTGLHAGKEGIVGSTYD